MTPRVHTELTALDRLGLSLPRTSARFGGGLPQQDPDPLDQDTLRKWLANEVIRPELEAAQFVDFLLFGGQEDHRLVGLLPQAPQQFHAIHTRHLDIENDEVRGLVLKPWSAENPSE